MKPKITIVLLLTGCVCTLLNCSNKINENTSLNEAKEKPPEEVTSVKSTLVQGGLLVYDSAGHGLIAAPSDLGKYDWASAMTACDALELNGYNDWRLPTKEELNILYTNLKSTSTGGFESSSYWSSSEFNNYYAWRQNFNFGRTDRRGNKTKKNFVRAVRSY